MTNEKKKLNFNPSVIYEKTINIEDPEIMKKLRYGLPLNVIDIEFDTPREAQVIKDKPLIKKRTRRS